MKEKETLAEDWKKIERKKEEQEMEIEKGKDLNERPEHLERGVLGLEVGHEGINVLEREEEARQVVIVANDHTLGLATLILKDRQAAGGELMIVRRRERESRRGGDGRNREREKEERRKRLPQCSCQAA